MKRVLCILENGFEEIETITPIDLLRRAGAEVVLASVSEIGVIGKCGIKIIADALLSDVKEQEFDALFLPGGPAVMQLRKNAEVINLIRRFHEEKKCIAAICAAPLLLKDAELLEGKHFTSHSTTTTELPQSNGERVVIDGQLLTSRGAGTAFEFGLTFVEMLFGKATSDEVSNAVMA